MVCLFSGRMRNYLSSDYEIECGFVRDGHTMFSSNVAPKLSPDMVCLFKSWVRNYLSSDYETERGFVRDGHTMSMVVDC